jgi:hypothetical protein
LSFEVASILAVGKALVKPKGHPLALPVSAGKAGRRRRNLSDDHQHPLQLCARQNEPMNRFYSPAQQTRLSLTQRQFLFTPQAFVSDGATANFHEGQSPFQDDIQPTQSAGDGDIKPFPKAAVMGKHFRPTLRDFHIGQAQLFDDLTQVSDLLACRFHQRESGKGAKDG